MGNINIAEILRDSPKGTKLYSPIFGDVYLDKIRPHLAIVVIIDKEQGDFKEEFLYDGRYGMNGECMIFPSKDQRDWSKFHRPFKDGDILAYDNRFAPATVFIYRYYDNHWNTSYFIGLSGLTGRFFKDATGALDGYNPRVRFATEGEKQKLFDTIKANGYKWNAETKTLEKLKKDKFDITTLKPFDKVLVRQCDIDCWKPALWGRCTTNKNFIFITSFGVTSQAIPFKNNEWLVGTTNDCDDYYKTWK